MIFVFFLGCFFKKSVKTAVPDAGNPPGALVSTKLIEWYRFVVCFVCFCWGCFFRKSVKTAAPEDGRPPGALVLTKLIEWYRFGVGDEKSISLTVGTNVRVLQEVKRGALENLTGARGAR